MWLSSSPEIARSGEIPSDLDFFWLDPAFFHVEDESPDLVDVSQDLHDPKLDLLLLLDTAAIDTEIPMPMAICCLLSTTQRCRRDLHDLAR